MTQNARFIATAAALLVLAWLFSGERLLDAVFEMPDAGPLDDAVIALTVAAEDLKARLGLPDVFGALRATLHALLGV
ncbi:MAG: hypothetical protein KDK53_11170 [Maritimibacter sp.]|nr:hypothetical protein [Maritimibacter sp.]